MSISRELKCVGWQLSNGLLTAENESHCSLQPNSIESRPTDVLLSEISLYYICFFKQIKETVPSPVTFLYEVTIDIQTQVSIVRCYCLFIDFVFSMPRNSGYKNCNKILEYIILTFLSVSACSLIIISRKCTCWLLFINIYI